MENKNVHNELEELATILSSIPKVHNKNVPKHYFEELPDITWDKIKVVDKKGSNRTISLVSKVVGLAACFTLLFFAVIGNNDTSELTEEIPLESVVAFILEDTEAIDEELLFQIHLASTELILIEDDNLDYLLEESIDDIDDQFLETLY